MLTGWANITIAPNIIAHVSFRLAKLELIVKVNLAIWTVSHQIFLALFTFAALAINFHQIVQILELTWKFYHLVIFAF